jgi:Pyruvate/2-oxoacid:ferredoxin oxidoreductase delta subunit
VLSIDIDTGLPIMGSQDGSGYLSGEAIRPVTMKYVYDIARYVDIPVLGVGGVRRAEHVVEMTMVGASVVGMVAAPLLSGLQVFEQVEHKLRRYLAGRGIADINSLRKLTHRRVQASETIYGAKAIIDVEACTDCGLCTRICFQRAPAEIDGTTRIRRERCVGCGLCVSVCPQDAIALEG